MKKLLILSLAGLLAVTQVSDIVAKKKDKKEKKEKKKQKKAKNQTTTNAESENNYPGDYPE